MSSTCPSAASTNTPTAKAGGGNFIEKLIEDRKLYSPSNPVRKSSGSKESMAAVNEMKSELAALKEELAKTREALDTLDRK